MRSNLSPRLFFSQTICDARGCHKFRFGAPIRISIVLIVCMFSVLVASAQVSEPNLDSSAYIRGGPNPFAELYSGQCTWYAWGRAKEKMGVGIDFTYPSGEVLQSGRHAGNWLNIVRHLPQGTIPAPNSIAVWSHPNEDGHVAFIEAIQGNVATVTQANRDGRARYDGQSTMSLSDLKRGSTMSGLNGNQMILSGFIYVPFFYSNVEDNNTNQRWSDTGLWHVTARRSNSRTHSRRPICRPT